ASGDGYGAVVNPGTAQRDPARRRTQTDTCTTRRADALTFETFVVQFPHHHVVKHSGYLLHRMHIVLRMLPGQMSRGPVCRNDPAIAKPDRQHLEGGVGNKSPIEEGVGRLEGGGHRIGVAVVTFAMGTYLCGSIRDGHVRSE